MSATISKSEAIKKLTHFTKESLNSLFNQQENKDIIKNKNDYEEYFKFNNLKNLDGFYEQSNCILYKNEPKLRTESDNERINREKLINVNKIPTIEDAVFDYRLGTQEAFSYIYKYFKPKIEYMAMEKSHYNMIVYDELISEITFQLFKCVNKYKGGSIKFSTFFWRCAQNVVGIYYTRCNTKKRSNEFADISLDTAVDLEDKTMQEVVSDKNVMEMFNSINHNLVWKNSIRPLLQESEAKLFELCATGYDTKDVCKIMNISKQAISLKLKVAMEKILKKFTDAEIKIMLMRDEV